MRRAAAGAAVGVSVGAAVSLPLLLAPPAAAGDPAYGAYLASECVACHRVGRRSGEGRSGEGHPAGGIPPITGWPPDAFVAAMKEYRARTRDNPVMRLIAGGLGDEEIAALAAYFGGLPLAE